MSRFLTWRPMFAVMLIVTFVGLYTGTISLFRLQYIYQVNCWP